MELQYPIEAIHNNIALLKNHSVMAFYTIPYFSIVKGKVEAKNELKRKIGSSLRKLVSGEWFEIHLVPRDFLLKEKMIAMSHVLNKGAIYQKAGEQLLGGTYRTLTQEMEIPFNYEWLIGVPLVKENQSLEIKEAVSRTVNKTSQTVAEFLGYQVSADDNWWEEWGAEELGMRQTLSSIEPSAPTEDEFFYYQKLQYLPYISHEKGEVCANRAKSNVTDTMIYGNKLGRLHFVSEYGESYTAILPIGKSLNILNNNHLAEMIQSFNFPVRYSVKAQFTKPKGVNGLNAKLGSAKTRAKQIKRVTFQNGNTSYKRVELGALALDDAFKKVDEQEPIIEYYHFLVVAASSKKQLRIRKKTVKNAFQTKKIALSDARMDNPYLFQSLLMGNKPDLTARFWRHSATSRGLAEHLFFTTTKSGNETGFYLGRVDVAENRWEDLKTAIRASRNIVLYDPMLALKEGIKGKKTKNVHDLITGETGSGKTVLAQDIYFQALLSKIKTLYVDPKRTLRKHWLSVANDPEWSAQNPATAEIIKAINFVTLDAKAEENQGVLDPIVILDYKDAISTSKSMLYYLGKDKKWTDRQTTAISKAIKVIALERKNGKTVGMKQVVERLRNNSETDIRDVGESIYEMLDDSLLSLIFSDGTVKGLSYNSHATVLEIADLTLPEKGKRELTEDERQSVVLMQALGKFCQRFGERNENEDTIEFFDEAWILMASSEGQNVVKSMRRVGRSQHNKLVLITQSVKDIDTTDDTTGFGTLFTFYEKNEASAILKHIGLEDTESNKKWLASMQGGQCIYLDVFEHLNRISIDIPPYLLDLFSPEVWKKKMEARQESLVA